MNKHCLYLFILFFTVLYTYANVKTITTITEYNQLKKDSDRIILQCFATWCPACTKSKSLFETLSNHQLCKNITFARIDIDIIPEIKTELGLIGVPTFVFIEKQQQKHIEIGIKFFDDFQNHMLQLIHQSFKSNAEIYACNDCK